MPGWGEPTTPSPTAELDRVLDAYDRLWHRAGAHRFGQGCGQITDGLPAPHELRTGQGPSDVMDALRRGHHQETTG